MVIVGIDPGTTTGVAVLDLDGEMVDYTSRKNFSKDRVIEFIVENGNPLIVASDVSPAPSTVEEIASNMGSVLESPDEDLETGYKEEIASGFGVDGDSHVLDALAAAEYARREYSDILHSIEKRVGSEGLEPKYGDVVELVVKGSMPLSRAVREVEKAGETGAEEAGETREEVERDWKKVAEERRKRIELLESKVENLEEYLEEKDEEENGSRPTLSELRSRNRVIQDLKSKIERKEAYVERLEEENRSLEEAVENLGEGWIYVPKAGSLAEQANPVVYIEDYGGEDVSPEVDTVLTPGGSDGLEEKGVEVVDADEVGESEMVELEEGLVVDPEAVETNSTSERFMSWLEDYRKR